MTNNRNVSVPVDNTGTCPVCNETARRDEKLIDALQTARFILTSRDITLAAVRDARIKASLDVALRLLGTKW